MLALSIDNLLFFLLIAVAVLFQLLSKAISKAGKTESDERSDSPPPNMPPPIRRAPRETDAERIRKFLEALGQPPSSAPPPPVVPRTDTLPRRLAPVQPPPVIPGTWPLPRERRQKPDVTQKESLPPEQPRRVEQIAPPPVPAPAAPAFEVHETLPVELQQPPIEAPLEAYAAATRPVAKGAGFKTDIATLLASKSSLREAIVLREIFGPPRGLQEVDRTL